MDMRQALIGLALLVLIPAMMLGIVLIVTHGS